MKNSSESVQGSSKKKEMKIKTEEKPSMSIREAFINALQDESCELESSLSSIHGSADEILMAVLECVLTQQKENEEKGVASLKTTHLINRFIKKFITTHVALLGAEGSVKLIRTIEKRIIEGNNKAEARTLGHLLSIFIGESSTVLTHEKIRVAVRDAIPNLIAKLWSEKKTRDASFALGRVFVLVLLSERFYLESGVNKSEDASVWRCASMSLWRNRVLGIDEKLRNSVLFSLLTCLLEEHEPHRDKKRKGRKRTSSDCVEGFAAMNLNDLTEESLERLERENVEGEEGELSSRAQLAFFIVPILPTLRVRISDHAYDLLVGFVVRVYEERQELHLLMRQLRQLSDFIEEYQPVIRHIIKGVQKTLSNCTEEKEGGRQWDALIDKMAAEKIIDTSNEDMGKSAAALCTTVLTNYSHISVKAEKHSHSCGCSGMICRSLSALLMIPFESPSMQWDITRLVESCVILILCAFEPTEGQLFSIGSTLLEKLMERVNMREESLVKEERREWPECGVILLKGLKLLKNDSTDKCAHSAISLSRSILNCYADKTPSSSLLFLDVGYTIQDTDYSLSALSLAAKAQNNESITFAKKLLKVRKELNAEESDRKSLKLLGSWIQSLDSPSFYGLSYFILSTIVSLSRTLKEEYLPIIFSGEKGQKVVDGCLSLVLSSSPYKDGRVEKELALIALRFLLNCTPYMEVKVSPADLCTWSKLTEMDNNCVQAVIERASPQVQASLFPSLLSILSSPSIGCPPSTLLTLVSRTLNDRTSPHIESSSIVEVIATVISSCSSVDGTSQMDSNTADSVFQFASKALSVFGDNGTSILSVALAAMTVFPPRDNSIGQLYVRANLLLTCLEKCMQGILNDQAALFIQLWANLLIECSQMKGEEREKQRILQTCNKIAMLMGQESHFEKIAPFIVSECIIPLSRVPPSTQFPLVVAAHSVNKHGRSFLATTLPPAERLAYARLFPTVKETNKKVV